MRLGLVVVHSLCILKGAGDPDVIDHQNRFYCVF